MVAVPVRAHVKLRQLSSSRWAIALAVVGVAGIVLRVWIYRGVLGIPTADEALVGLWAIHASHGDFTTFFWGLHYGGTQEPLLSVPLFLLFGPSWLALKILPLALLGALPWLAWNVRHHFGSLDMLSFGVQSSYWHRLRIFVSPLMPIILGLRYPFSQAQVLPGQLSNLIYGVLILLVAFVAYRIVRKRRLPNASMLYVVALVFPFLY